LRELEQRGVSIFFCKYSAITMTDQQDLNSTLFMHDIHIVFNSDVRHFLKLPNLSVSLLFRGDTCEFQWELQVSNSNSNLNILDTKWWINFVFSYNTIKTDMQKGNSQTQLSPGSHMLAASEAGILTLAMTNPIWVVKTR
jgi:hypothetical protein